MAITKDDVKYIAKLAKLRFDDDEAQVFAGEFENILEQFKTLDKLNLDDVEIENTIQKIWFKQTVKSFFRVFNEIIFWIK